jgi:hypothetical protein
MAALGVAGVVVGLCGLVYPQAVRGPLAQIFAPPVAPQAPASWEAVGPETESEAAESEIAIVAREIAAVLASVEAGAPEAEIAAAVHRYLAGSEHGQGVQSRALARTLERRLSATQTAALNSLYSQYAPADVAEPGGGAPLAAPSANVLRTASVTPPGARGGSFLRPQPASPPPLPDEGTPDVGSPPAAGGDAPVAPPAPPAEDVGVADPPPTSGGDSPVVPPPPEEDVVVADPPPSAGGDSPVEPAPPVDEEEVVANDPPPSGGDGPPFDPPPLPPAGGGSDYRL